MDLGTLGHGFVFEDLPVGARFRTGKRTITEADLVAFVNLCWFTEELFTNLADRDAMAIKGRVVPAALVYSFAEGLMTPAMQHTGLAFLNAEVDVKGPTLVGDTIQVEAEVIEARRASSGNRGLVRTKNEVRKQDGGVVMTYTPLRLLAGRAGG
jgi:acyl dehydratase